MTAEDVISASLAEGLGIDDHNAQQRSTKGEEMSAQPGSSSSGTQDEVLQPDSKDSSSQKPGLNASAVEFVPGSSFVPKARATAKQNKQNGYHRNYSHAGYPAISPEHSGQQMYQQGWEEWNQQGYQQHQYPANGYPQETTYEDMNGQQYGDGYGYAQGYGMENGSPEYEASGEYEQYDGAYANGNMAHDAVYQSLFDEQQSPQPAAGQQNGWVQPGMTSPRSQLLVTPMEAMMAVLSEQYPAYSKGSLREILDLSEGNIEGALDMLARTEANAPKADPGAHGKAAATPAQKPPTLDENNFPSLSTGPSPKNSPEGKGSPPAASKAPGDSPVKPEGKDFAIALQQQDKDSKAAAAFGLSGKGRQPLANGNAGFRAQNGGQRQGGGGRSREEAAIPWVETGEAVAAAYAKARQEARDFARLRNMCFQQATQAYLAGNKALAKELGAKGRAHAEQMQAAHAVAADAIYKQRNAQKVGGGLRLIDLHGLHAKEAVDALRREIASVRSSKQATRQPGTVRLSVIVGTGHHTKGKHTPAKLPAAVQTFLETEGISHRQSTPGMLDIAV